MNRTPDGLIVKACQSGPVAFAGYDQIEIMRFVQFDETQGWRYRITKSGVQATRPLRFAAKGNPAGLSAPLRRRITRAIFDIRDRSRDPGAVKACEPFCRTRKRPPKQIVIDWRLAQLVALLRPPQQFRQGAIAGRERVSSMEAAKQPILVLSSAGDAELARPPAEQ